MTWKICHFAIRRMRFDMGPIVVPMIGLGAGIEPVEPIVEGVRPMFDVRKVFLTGAVVMAVAGISAFESARADNIIDEWASVKVPPAPELKPVTVDAKTTALLMLDFLPGVYCSTKPRCMSALPAMKKLLTEARAKGATVIYSVAGNYSAADILKDVAPVANEPWVKSFSDKFMNTDLEKILKDKGIQTVIVTGTSANGAVLYTGSGAGLRGLKVIVPVDGLSAADLYAEQITVWQLANGPRFGANVTLTKSDMIKF